MRLAAGHFRRRTSSSALDARVLLAAEAWISRASESRPVPMLADGTTSRAVGGRPCSPEAGWTDRHRHVLRLVQPGRYRPRTCSSPWQSPWSLRRGETDCEISRWDPGRCMDAGGRPRTLTVSAGRGATRGRSGNVEGERLLDAKRAFPFRIYGQTRPGRTAASTAVPGVLLTRKRSQVQTLSRPPARC
jgi:hypothetical protein